jgi:hypothetical protein
MLEVILNRFEIASPEVSGFSGTIEAPATTSAETKQSGCPTCGAFVQWRPVRSNASWLCIDCRPPQSSRIAIEQRDLRQFTQSVLGALDDDPGVATDDEIRRLDTSRVIGVCGFVQTCVPWCLRCGSSVGVETPAGSHCYTCGDELPHWPIIKQPGKDIE